MTKMKKRKRKKLLKKNLQSAARAGRQIKRALVKAGQKTKRALVKAGQKTKKIAAKIPVIKKLRGGAVSLNFESPLAKNASANSAMNQAISKQKMNAHNMVNLNKDLAGGGSPDKLSVPQMSQAGGEGNSLMKGMIDLQLQTRAMSEGDSQAMMSNPGGVAGMAGGRKSRKKRKKRRRKTKKRTKRLRRRRKSRKRKK